MTPRSEDEVRALKPCTPQWRKRPTLRNTPERFFGRTKWVGECLEWQGGLLPNGYGTTTWNMEKISTHRLAWRLANGSIPKGLMVLHKCNNKKCVNHKHLYLGTASDNMKDAVACGAYKSPWKARTHCSRGHEYTAESTAIEVRRGREMRVCRACRRERRIANARLKEHGRDEA